MSELLNVERLARAIMRLNPQPDYDSIPIERWDLYAGTVAAALAAEYARLTAAEEQTSDERSR